ncbi:acyl-CoA thioesterase [Umezawaea tangerina]|uniref:Acyl-CoA thioester hydrolase n=1 Tax=Umezawaea tangerina TaxID=84725 RepID=A0A2T0SSC1_9PSEU|nr:thioesterase family protein [Umezawaea tangerina]PRY36312.1 acyl-CoA thioester hydrolase [Umezawaea tangerina]HWO60562.1 thioesterase family protein [Umezawaea sp.]
MGVFVTGVRPRWSDMDAFGHVNHANTVTLLEEARIDLLFTEAARHGVTDMTNGMVVARLVVDYLTPIVFTGGEIVVEMSVRELRSASFLLDYTVRNQRGDDSVVVTKAETLMVPYNVTAARPRRLDEAERDFLAGWRAGGNGA